MFEERDNIIEDDIICDTSELSSEVAFNQTDKGKTQINENSELDLQLLEMIEKSDRVWICKVCGKNFPNKPNILRHAETHIEGMSHDCHICNKSYPNRHSLRCHIDKIHSELASCDLCGKSCMNERSLYHHKAKHHKTLS